MTTDPQALLQMTADLAKSYIGKNLVSSSELPDLISQFHQSLTKLAGEAEAPKPEPAISVRRSIKKDRIFCIECGKGHKTLKRHLRTAHDLTVDEYRERWNLSFDYPIVAPDYAAQRSKMAKKFGLGRKPGAKVKRRKKAA